MKRFLYYLSDIHLERKDLYPLLVNLEKEKDLTKISGKPAEYYMALVGDIGDPLSHNYREFLTYLSYNFNGVFLVAGNHEYINHSVQNTLTRDRSTRISYWKDEEETDSSIRRVISPFPNIKYLKQETATVGGTTFYGATLWTPAMDPNSYLEDVFWLWGTLPDKTSSSSSSQTKDEKDEKQTIVLTHYPPSRQLIPKKYKEPRWISSIPYYYNDLDNFLETRKVDVWIYGHTHSALRKKIKDTLCLTNAYVYSQDAGDKIQLKD